MPVIARLGPYGPLAQDLLVIQVPVAQGAEVAAGVDAAEVRVGAAVVADPEKGHDAHVAGTHDALAEVVDTVTWGT